MNTSTKTKPSIVFWSAAQPFWSATPTVEVSSRPQEPMTVSPGSSISLRLPRTPTKLRRASRRSSPLPTSSNTLRSRTGASGCVRKASSASLETSRKKSKRLFGPPIMRRRQTCSAGMPLAPPGSRSRLGTSWPTTTALSIRTWNASRRSVWALPPMPSTVATSRCCPTPAWSSTFSVRPPKLAKAHPLRREARRGDYRR
jgi:hypothetical protein